ncbi:LOW QUALITY PROTEIN: probable LRR receptor-like serine/threonine-protein kinase At4g36180 [Ananas comosus]|uniref:LOW QUALITY PROTEIN: probable LRR receptor-like serine/threonine-protein kinase At4g36180 n=1 Tax=Ananas comosus TaxID=4615 RepID=A0A6P5G325_ANACO|nr:LOW QUALITY PROTEIN: probable LRR receptor-like serine/threonine-protein kinase At4g36180 [Ananas comosus]
MRATATSMQLFIILLVVWLLKNQILESYGCLSVEREALLAFKSGVVDPRNCLSSWEGSNCCRWKGVWCNNKTSRVEKLILRLACGTSSDTSYEGFGGEVNPSLLSLSHLKHLDLSMNNFSTSFPNFIASYKKLRYLNLSSAGFTGVIPPEFGNLSTLRYLDLSNRYYNDSTTSHGKLSWIKGLSSLKYLDLTFVMLQNAYDWLQAVNMLSSLQVLRLGSCSLPSNPDPTFGFNLTSLSTLDLRENYFNSTLPDWLWSFTSLTDLNLNHNNFYGPIPVELGNLTSLTSLCLGSNNLAGPVPNSIKNLCKLNTLSLSGCNLDRDIIEFLSELSCVSLNNWRLLDLQNTNIKGNLSGWLEHMTSLKYLDVSNNFLNGSIPVGINKLSNLAFLDLHGNSFAGVILETHLMNFTRLKFLRVSGTSLELKVEDNWVPPFQVQELVLRSCRLGPRFPRWLRLQQEIEVLDLSNNWIAGTIPYWFWDISSSIRSLGLYNNQISGILPSSLRNMTSLEVLNLRSNYLRGFLPFLPDSLKWVDFSSNEFFGSLSQSFFKPNLIGVLLSNNSISDDGIPSSICNMQSLSILDMSNNNLFGELPNCWNGVSNSLNVIDLSSNKLSGQLPDSLGCASKLEFLHLNNNSLYGELPSALQNCPLVLLDLGQNKLSGEIPMWLGKLTNLIVLRLMSNMFAGNIPAELGQLENLQILDLSWNNLSGNIPQSFGSFPAMASIELSKYMIDIHWLYVNFFLVQTIYGYRFNCMLYNYSSQRLYIATKGSNLQFSKNLFFEKSIDLSGNKLDGAIPAELADLSALHNLNLSRNHLKGRIPDKIGNLQSLESLDLSMNELNGTIPQSITALKSLSNLNLSYNNLSGRIPSGDQIQTLVDPTIYAGNPYLCGPPISKNCSGNEPTYTPDEKKQHNGGLENIEIYLVMGLGFIVGLWGVYGVLLFKSAWRNTYFYIIDKMYYKFFAGN